MGAETNLQLESPEDNGPEKVLPEPLALSVEYYGSLNALKRLAQARGGVTELILPPQPPIDPKTLKMKIEIFKENTMSLAVPGRSAIDFFFDDERKTWYARPYNTENGEQLRIPEVANIIEQFYARFVTAGDESTE